MNRSFQAAAFFLALNLCFYSPAQSQVRQLAAVNNKGVQLTQAEIKGQAYRDSLEKALVTSVDSNKQKLLWYLAQAYINIDPRKSLACEKQRLVIGLKTRNLHIQTSAYICMSRAAIYVSDLTDAKNWLKQGYALAEKQKDSNNMSRALLNLGDVYQGSSDHTNALDCFIRSVHISAAFRDTAMTTLGILNIGTIYYSQNDFKKAEEYSLQARPMLNSSRSDPQVAPKMMEVLGTIYYKENKLPLARACYDQALQLYETQKNEVGMATLYSHFAGIYLSTPDSVSYYAFKANRVSVF